MFEQGNINNDNNVAAERALKVRPCFIRLMRDKDVDQRLSKKCKKNEAEVISILFGILFIILFLKVLVCKNVYMENNVRRC